MGCFQNRLPTPFLASLPSFSKICSFSVTFVIFIAIDSVLAIWRLLIDDSGTVVLRDFDHVYLIIDIIHVPIGDHGFVHPIPTQKQHDLNNNI